ncbi:MAG: amidase [Candidatus Palauibacterales bacterium]|nr:amidase [Candidatus Palauibacterales bacterium]
MKETTEESVSLSGVGRRDFLAAFSSLGLGGTLFPGALWATMQRSGGADESGSDLQEVPELTTEHIRDAERVVGIEFTAEERELMLEKVREQLADYRALREVEVPNHVPLALRFDPVPADMELPDGHGRVERSPVSVGSTPSAAERLAFEPVTHLAERLRRGHVTSVELTRMYLDRLRRHDGELNCVVTLTEELALRQARRADREIDEGTWRGPLHGIPWGAKDLLAVRGYPTTWGAEPFRDQELDFDASVARRLEDAGAVLVAKLSMGALAKGDVWFGGTTRNPWDTEEGSSGSSAGPGAATAAGLVGFSIGTETLGSIVSPSNRCGVTGLRPTFGRVSRYGAMALSISQDKIGPMCRSVEDCALVLDAIHGPDGHDRAVRDVPFDWDAARDPGSVRLGYYRSAFEDDDASRFDRRALEVLREMGFDPVPVSLPDEQFPVEAISFHTKAEEAAIFDSLTRSGRDDMLTSQDEDAWPNEFRRGQLIPAVQYLQANRVRSMVMAAMRNTMSEVDVFVTPTYGGSVLTTTNLTGHPSVTLPNGFEEDGTPVSISFIGSLYGESDLLLVARAYQEATGFHEHHPEQFAV